MDRGKSTVNTGNMWATVVVAWAVSISNARAEPQTIVLPGSTVGPTPAILGYNSGHFLPGSNVADWWRYSGVNGSRIFSNLSWLTPTTSFRSSTNSSLDATSQSSFNARKAALRASGTASTFVDWSGIQNRYLTGLLPGNNAIQPDHAQSSMATLGIKPLIVMTRSPAAFFWPASAADNSPAAWQARWLAWQQWYAHAFVHARFNDVAGFQFFNEPDLYTSSTATLSQEQLVEMIRFGGDAVQAAIADVNRLFDRNLEAVIYAPVTSGPKLEPGDWGHTVATNHGNPLTPASSPDGRLFQRFAYHNYGSNPERFGTRLAETADDLDRITGGQGANYPVVLTEFNTRTSANYSPNDPAANPNGFTPDSVAMSSRLGQILTNLANNQPEELYLFKFSDAGGANNGVHWQSSSGSHNVGGVTRSGMVYQLFTEGFTASDLLASPSGGPSSVTFAAASSVSDGTRYLFAANADLTNSANLRLDLSDWNVSPGSRVTVRQVSSRHQGDVSHQLTVGEDRTLALEWDPGGVVLVRVPRNPVSERVTIAAADAATVNQGQPTATFSGGDLRVRNSGSAAAQRDVAYLRFSLDGLDRSRLVTDSMLTLTGWNPGSDAAVVTHVYGLEADDWEADTLTWSTAPNLGLPSGTISMIDHNYVTGVGESAHIVGQFVATGTERQLSIDVSDWVRERMAADSSSIGFMIAREIRFDGDVDATNYLRIRAGGPGGEGLAPSLMLALAPPAPDPGTLLWYGDGGHAGGSGTWTTDGVNWWNGTSLQAWDPGFTAVFPGVGGQVGIDAGVTAAGMRVDGSGYSFSGDALSAIGASLIEISSGARLAIDAADLPWVIPAGQTLGGLGTVDGSVVFGAGATLAPGSMATTVATAITVPEPSIGLLAAGTLAMVLASGLRRGE